MLMFSERLKDTHRGDLLLLYLTEIVVINCCGKGHQVRFVVEVPVCFLPQFKHFLQNGAFSLTSVGEGVDWKGQGGRREG